MTFDKNKFALSSGLTMGIVYIICRVFVAIAPSSALKLLGWWIHTLNLEQLAGATDLSLFAFVAGFISTAVLTYAVAWIFASIYNGFVGAGNK